MQLDAKQLLTDAGLKQTKARLALVKIFRKVQKPIDASDLMKHLAEENVDADQATVYRILDIFQKAGIIHRFEFQEGKFRYELAGITEHHHLLCESCGKIEDISDCNISDLEDDIKRKKGFLVKRHALEFFGLCSSCLQET